MKPLWKRCFLADSPSRNRLPETKRGKGLELWERSSGQSENVEELAARTGDHRTTVSRWLSIYRKVGRTSLLNIKKSSGRSRKIDQKIENCLVGELKDPEGFISYGEVQQWLKVMWDVEMSYTGVHKMVRYRLESKLKVPRPCHIKQKEGVVESFKKN